MIHGRTQKQPWSNYTNGSRGESVHNTEAPGEGGECCPDFSCCNRSVNTPLAERREFRDAYLSKKLRESNGMLMGYLGGMLVAEGVDAHITDGRRPLRSNKGPD